MKTGFIISGLLCLAFIAFPAYGFHCPNGNISTGDSEYSVIRKCGEPRYKSVVSQNRDGDPITVKWFYKWDHKSFEYILTIRNGKVVRIQAGNK